MENPLLPIRNAIDAIDRQLLPLFLERMHCSEEVARIKAEKGLPILNPQREEEILSSLRETGGEYAEALYRKIFMLSRERQHRLLEHLPVQNDRQCAVFSVSFAVSAPADIYAVLERLAFYGLELRKLETTPFPCPDTRQQVRLLLSAGPNAREVSWLLTSLSTELDRFAVER